MPTIPTPFIGGSDSPRREQAQKGLAPPFHPEAEATEASGSDTEAELDEPSVLEGASTQTDETAAGEEITLDEVEESEGVVPVVEVESEGVEEPALAPSDDAADLISIDVVEEEIEVPHEISELTADSLEEVAAEEFAAELMEHPEEETVGTDDQDAYFPDFLDGSDGVELAEPQSEEPIEQLEAVGRASEQEASASSRERLAELADELRAGEFGGLIRTLIDELGPYAADIGIARAFAAGYMAGKDREEK